MGNGDESEFENPGLANTVQGDRQERVGIRP
jgi:hypothetical protein